LPVLVAFLPVPLRVDWLTWVPARPRSTAARRWRGGHICFGLGDDVLGVMIPEPEGSVGDAGSAKAALVVREIRQHND
jgi:hypothetical protein